MSRPANEEPITFYALRHIYAGSLPRWRYSNEIGDLRFRSVEEALAQARFDYGYHAARHGGLRVKPVDGREVIGNNKVDCCELVSFRCLEGLQWIAI
jgi:hypothetical protein